MKRNKSTNYQLLTTNWRRMRPGQMIIVALILLMFILMIVGTLFGRTAQFLRFGGNSTRQEQALNMAEAGIDYAIWKLNKNAGNYPATNELVTIPNAGQFEITISNPSGSYSELQRFITSTGCIPDCTNPRSKHTIKLDLAVATFPVAFYYAIQTGLGGLNMTSGNSRVTGNVWAGCPSPCSIANIGSTGTITGDAYATGTISGVTVSGASYPNQPASPPNQPAPPLPTVTYQQWRDAAGTSICDTQDGIADGIITASISIGPCKQPGPLAINGGSTVTITGPVWIGADGSPGAFSLAGGSVIKPADNFGSADVAVIVDGNITLSGGSAIQANNSSGLDKGYVVLATTSTGTGSPYAFDLSGGVQTGVFYILEGTANLSGNATLTAVVAKTLNIAAATLTYDTGLATTALSSGPGGSWQVNKGTYRYTSSP